MIETTDSFINCLICNAKIKIRVYSNPLHDEYNKPIVKNKKTKFCSKQCQKQWQQSITWEDRVGSEFAENFRIKMSKLSSENNPSTFPGVSAKISKSLSRYLKNNPRSGELNPFYGKTHTDEFKIQMSKSKKGKWSYNIEQKQRQFENTPRGSNHPNWKGGISNEPYCINFNKDLKIKIKLLYSNKCFLCNASGKSLDIHHIDYNKKNSNITNLIPLCKKCHSKTNFNRKFWEEYIKLKIFD